MSVDIYVYSTAIGLACATGIDPVTNMSGGTLRTDEADGQRDRLVFLM